MTKDQLKNKKKAGIGNRLKNSGIVQAWLVLMLASFFGLALAGVQVTLGPTIEANKIGETLDKAPELVLGKESADKLAAQNQRLEINPFVITVEKKATNRYYNIYESRYQGELKGWVVKASGRGYADKIEMLLGLDPKAETITGLFIMDQKETPGLGNKIITKTFRNQFVDKATKNPLAVVKTGAVAKNEIDAITGATISTKSVVSIINSAVNDLKGLLTRAPLPKKERIKNG